MRFAVFLNDSLFLRALPIEEAAAVPMIPSLIASINAAVHKKGYKQKDAAKAIGVSSTAFSDILHGRRAINFDIARNIYHNLGVPANIVLA